jgi:hypothetical protein
MCDYSISFVFLLFVNRHLVYEVYDIENLLTHLEYFVFETTGIKKDFETTHRKLCASIFFSKLLDLVMVEF